MKLRQAKKILQEEENYNTHQVAKAQTVMGRWERNEQASAAKKEAKASQESSGEDTEEETTDPIPPESSEPAQEEAPDADEPEAVEEAAPGPVRAARGHCGRGDGHDGEPKLGRRRWP